MMQRIAIGVHVHSEPDRLHATLASVRANTKCEFELLLLPDGPDKPTQKVLVTLSDLQQLSTAEPRGAATCFNRLAISTEAEILVLLESGSIVAPGWLDYLLAALNVDPWHGLAGPSTNMVWNEQCKFPRASGDPEAIARTAQEAAQRFGNAWRTLEPLFSLADFCYVVRREVVEAIGAADEGYGLGPCWEMDYNIRAVRAGWRGVWACGAYVYRAPLTARRQREERLRFEKSKQRYQDKFCGLRLRGEKLDFNFHCRGGACEHFAPKTLVQIKEPFPPSPDTYPKAETPLPTRQPVTLSISFAEPFISCIMPTCNRRVFVPRAIDYFLRQDYANKELIIIDDGIDMIDDLIPDDDRIRYTRLADRRTIGAKRNLACELAHGEFILHWDDDDWYSPSRARVQVRVLLDHGVDVCGSSHVFFYDPTADQAWRYEYSGGVLPWLAGTTLAYRRDVWRRNPFLDIQIGEDTRFVRSIIAKNVHDLQDPSLWIGVIHPGNSSHHGKHGTYWHQQSIEVIHNLMGNDLHLYHAETEPSPPASAPLVSCIMPTYNRRAFVLLALQMFAQQDYPNKELLIVDDGSDPVSDLVEAVPGLRYLQLSKRTSIGSKRNLACQKARGEIIAQWDDDDWYAPNRISYQTAPIISGEADLTGLENSYVMTLPEGVFWTTRSALHQRMFVGNIHGGSLVVRKAILDQGLRYPDANLAEDAALIQKALRHGKRLSRLSNPGVFVYARHGGNTWRFEAGQFLDPRGWQRTTPPNTFPAEMLESYRKAALMCGS